MIKGFASLIIWVVALTVNSESKEFEVFWVSSAWLLVARSKIDAKSPVHKVAIVIEEVKKLLNKVGFILLDVLARFVFLINDIFQASKKHD